jgi:hypothetical protein
MGHDKAANKEPNNRYERGQLQITESGDGMSRGTSPGITGAKAYQKSGNDQNGNTL